MNKITIATRTSKLAMAQTKLVALELQRVHPGLHIDFLEIVTQGDKWLETPLYEKGGKGLFVKELEKAILDGRAQMAVHSLKDMPYECPKGLCISPILPRANPKDIFLSIKCKDIDSLPHSAVVGTSSMRRQLQLQNHRKDIVVNSLRGNIHTRISKLREGNYDAIILAAAGIERMGDLKVPFMNDLPTELMLPAVGQGVLAAEFSIDDAQVRGLISGLLDFQSLVCSKAERSLSLSVGGGCHTPLAGYATIDGDMLTLRGWAGDIKGASYFANKSAPIMMAEQLGKDVAKLLLSQGDLAW